MRGETVMDEARPTGVSGDVRFLEDGVIQPGKGVPILESLQDPHSVVGEELRLLRAKLQSLCQPRQLKCIAVTSALPGEGKSTLSVGLAAALARGPGRRVLLIEADLRRPTVSASLGLPPAPGLGEWLEGGLDQVPIRRVGSGGFFVLVAGQVSLERPEVLGSGLMEAVLRSARKAFDFVLLDATPVLPVADTILLQDLVDGFLLVARSRRTPREAILEALGRLAPDKVLGVVLNDHSEYKHSYKAHAYERYGMVYGQKPESGRKPRD
jgi:capsular exopolysaccharide synthesis family protein